MHRFQNKTQMILRFLEGSKRYFLLGALSGCLVVFF